MLKKAFSFFSNLYFKLRMSSLIRHLIIYFSQKSKNDFVITDLQLNIINEIKKNGYYKSSLNDLLINSNLITDFENDSESIKNKLLQRLSQNDDTLFKRGKKFVARYVEKNTPFCDLRSSVNLALDDVFYGIASNYLNSIPKLTNIDFWYNIPNASSNKIGSQNWHKDYEDKNLLKIFIYLDDVNEFNGPFSFVENSHEYHKAKLPQNLKRNYPNGVVVDEETIELFYSKNKIINFAGSKFTVLIVDTSGFHKGGYIQKGYRYLFTFTFTTFAGISPRNFKFSRSNLKYLKEDKLTSVFS